ncbi:hypothetical protein SVAN01_11025 [Stagonosporopsis vannaccii]|nr:hypothetical protein SVAN01_11025 [Stagonosporopsis vannaccii]
MAAAVGAAEQQSSRAAEQQSSRAAEQQSSRAAEQQSSRAAEQQSSRAAEQQSSRAAEQQSSRAAGQQTYVAVAAEVLQQLDLAQGALGQDLLAEDIGDLLDGNALAGLVVGCGAAGPSACAQQSTHTQARARSLPDYAVGALAQLLGDIVALVDDKLLVEDLEDLAVREVRHGGRAAAALARAGGGVAVRRRGERAAGDRRAGGSSALRTGGGRQASGVSFSARAQAQAQSRAQAPAAAAGAGQGGATRNRRNPPWCMRDADKADAPAGCSSLHRTALPAPRPPRASACAAAPAFAVVAVAVALPAPVEALQLSARRMRLAPLRAAPWQTALSASTTTQHQTAHETLTYVPQG